MLPETVELEVLLWALGLQTLKQVVEDLRERNALYQGAHPKELRYCLERAEDIYESRR